ncbi:MAG TPA: hypothetical protein VFE36_12755 [Candidatus Baltobacteraceae bacterium]|nr:hypothetical protein [Candidatus Baltobacteraceae bacterium]
MTLAATIIICVVIAALGIWFQVRYSARAVTQGPALLTMLGIAGTFLGIAIGLYSFNTGDVQGSIPYLIEGIRTSVWASFTGILFAILIKLRYAFAQDEDAATGDKSDVEVLVERLEAIRKAIAADNDLTVTSEIKLMRSEVAYKLEALQRSVAELAERETGSRTP